MTEPVAVEVQTKSPKSDKAVIITLIVIALASVAVAAYEYQHSALLVSELEHANAQNASQQQQLAELQQQVKRDTADINDLRKDSMPVSLLFRHASSGNGLVAFFKNNSPAAFDISVLITNPVNHHSREANLSIPANSAQSIGEAEGWIFESGQQIRITNVQFGSAEYVVP